MLQILYHCRYGIISSAYKNITKPVILGVNKNHMTIWTIKNIKQEKPLLKIHTPNKDVCSRNYAMLALKVLRSVLKVRYLILGGTYVGAVTLHNKYTEWKDLLPDLSWLLNLINIWKTFTGSLITLRDSVKDITWIPKLKEFSNSKYNEVKGWLGKQLVSAINAANVQSWLQKAIPDANKWNTFKGSLTTLKDSVKDNITLYPKLKEFSDSKYNGVKEWLGERLQQKKEVRNDGKSENKSTQQNYSED